MRNLVIGDTHFSPKTFDSDLERIEKLAELAQSSKVDNVIFIGDVASFDSICRHEANHTRKGKEKPSLDEDFQCLGGVIDVFTRKTRKRNQNSREIRKFVTLGNHDWQRLLRFENEVPETAGVFTNLLMNIYGNAGIRVTKYGDMLELGDVLYTHCPVVMGKELSGATAEARTMKLTMKSVVFGHTHRLALLTENRFGREDPIFVLNVGCSLPYGYIEPYAQHSLSHWSWGVCLVETRGGSLSHLEFVNSKDLYG